MAYSFLEELTINPTIEPQNLHSTLGGHKQKLVCTRTQEKGAATPKETDPDVPVSVQESLVRRVLVVARCRAGGTEGSGASWDLLKEATVILIASTTVWSQVKQQGGTTAPPISRKLD